MNNISGKLGADEVIEFAQSLYTKFILNDFQYGKKSYLSSLDREQIIKSSLSTGAKVLSLY